MSEALTGFGSGPYNTLKYDRSWVTARVTLGVSTADAWAADAVISDTLDFGSIVEAIKTCRRIYLCKYFLGMGLAIPAVSIGGNYGVGLTIGRSCIR